MTHEMKLSTDELFVIRTALEHMRRTRSGSRPVRDIAWHLLERIDAEVGG